MKLYPKNPAELLERYFNAMDPADAIDAIYCGSSALHNDSDWLTGAFPGIIIASLNGDIAEKFGLSDEVIESISGQAVKDSRIRFN